MSVRSLITIGSNAILVDIQCHLSNNLPNIVIVGCANKAVDEARERLRGAFASAKLKLPRKRIVINLAPADIPKADSGFDLAIAVAILQADGQIALPSDAAVIGELGLDGHTRAVRGIIGKLVAGRAKGITDYYIPASNLSQASLVPGLKLYPVLTIGELHYHLSGLSSIEVVYTSADHNQQYEMSHNVAQNFSRGLISMVVGQSRAKRALEISAAGGHNVLLSGPPGTGKSMLAKAMPSIMPGLNQEEILEVTQIHSLASFDYDQIIFDRPFQAPHHSASHASVIGGGVSLKPGQISLAHNGILFFDELPEFSHQTLEALRQPLEDHQISISRVKSSATFPAKFILVATANPCPCGFYGHEAAGACRCLPLQILRYQQKLSGPILDRIDLQTSVHEVDHETLLIQEPDPAVDTEIRHRVRSARNIQLLRQNGQLNAHLANGPLKDISCLEPAAKELLDTAARKLNLSARGYIRTVKVARTIADLENQLRVSPAHVSEAIAYRPQMTTPV